MFFFHIKKTNTPAASQLKVFTICVQCPINGTASARINHDEIQQNAASHQGLHNLLLNKTTINKENL